MSESKTVTNEMWLNFELAVALVNAETYELCEDNKDAYRKVEGWFYMVESSNEIRTCELTGMQAVCYLMANEVVA